MFAEEFALCNWINDRQISLSKVFSFMSVFYEHLPGVHGEESRGAQQDGGGW